MNPYHYRQDDMDENDSDDKLLEETLSSFWNYRDHALDNFWRPRLQRWQCLTAHQKHILPWYESYLNQIHDAIECNAKFYQALAVQAARDWDITSSPENWRKPSISCMKKTVSLFTQLAREWSACCDTEREIFLHRLKLFLERSYPPDARATSSILVPGAGLARIVVECVKLGFATEGNELSYHMLLLSRYLLNGRHPKEHFTIYPYVHSFSHHRSRADQLHPVSIPDMDIASEVAGTGIMSMTAGSMVDLYGPNVNIKQSGYYSNDIEMRILRANNANSKDVVVTCFFIDTAMNILDYIETIYHVLKNGGYWINFGPLLYHFENDSSLEKTSEYDPLTGSLSNSLCEPVKGLELSLEDILHVTTDVFKFELLENEIDIQSGYGHPSSSAGLKYNCDYWILQKTTPVSCLQ